MFLKLDLKDHINNDKVVLNRLFLKEHVKTETNFSYY
jgi:hypothetical protein